MLSRNLKHLAVVVAIVAAMIGSTANALIFDVVLYDEDYGTNGVGGVKHTGGIFDSPSTLGNFFDADNEVLAPDHAQYTGNDFPQNGQIHSVDGFSFPNWWGLEWRMNYVQRGGGGALALLSQGAPGTPAVELDISFHGDPIGPRVTELSTGGFSDAGPTTLGVFNVYELEVRTDLSGANDYARLSIDGSLAAEVTGDFSQGTNGPARNLQFLLPGNATTIIMQLDYLRFGSIPEPASATLMALGALSILRRRRRA
ncbi:MAG: hypothetical protein CMJ18_14965 [Phycisphaeraceae bacterium]|nr:hypothetical protein [Phycisphaeraceae bacterium]